MLSDLGGAYSDHGDLDTALEYSGSGLISLRGIGERLLEGEIIMKVGKLFLNRGEYRPAIDSLRRSAAIFEVAGQHESE